MEWVSGISVFCATTVMAASGFQLTRRRARIGFRFELVRPDVTHIINNLGAESNHSSEELFALVYEELRQMAAGKMAHEQRGHTLQATALVNEACLRLLGNDQNWESRRHFYGAASEAMRRILIESARRRRTGKRGGGAPVTEYRDSVHHPQPDNEKLLEVDEVLDDLEAEDPQKAQIVKLRFFVGLTIPEIANVLEIGERTVGRHWEHAKIWLVRALRDR